MMVWVKLITLAFILIRETKKISLKVKRDDPTRGTKDCVALSFRCDLREKPDRQVFSPSSPADLMSMLS